MTTLSARTFWPLKYVAPFFMVLCVTAWTYWSDVRHHAVESTWEYVLAFVVITIITIVVFRRGSWSKADHVDYSGDVLTVRRWKTSEAIPLSAIKSVHWEPYVGGRVVTIELSASSKFGTRVAFFSPDPKLAPSVARELEAIAERAKANGQGNVA